MRGNLAYVEKVDEQAWGIGGFIDTETTGLSNEDEVIELSLVLFAYDKYTGEIIGIVDEYTGLREPSVPIRRAASDVHGIYKRHVKGQDLDYSRLEKMMDDAEFLIAHNVKFDQKFIKRLPIKNYDKPWYCSMDGIPWKRYGFESKALQRLLSDHNIDVSTAHRANDDVKNALLLLSEKNHNGDFYLQELITKPQIPITRKKQPPKKEPVHKIEIDVNKIFEEVIQEKIIEQKSPEQLPQKNTSISKFNQIKKILKKIIKVTIFTLGIITALIIVLVVLISL